MDLPHLYATLCRFDEFLPGVAVALLKNAHPQIWLRITRYGHWLLLVGLTATGLMLYAAYYNFYIEGYGAGFFMTAFGYSLIAVAFAVLYRLVEAPFMAIRERHFPSSFESAARQPSVVPGGLEKL